MTGITGGRCATYESFKNTSVMEVTVFVDANRGPLSERVMVDAVV